MDVRIQKHRMARWLGWMVFVFVLAASCGVQAAVESVYPTPTNCNFHGQFPNLPKPFWTVVDGKRFPFSNDTYSTRAEAAQARFDYVTSIDYFNYFYDPSNNLVSYDQYGRVQLNYSSWPGGAEVPSPNATYTLFACDDESCSYRTTYDWGATFVTYDAPLTVCGMCCPIPIVNPSVPYVFNIDTFRCERPAQALTITLSGGTEVEPSNGSDKKFLPIIATVIDQSTQKPPTNPVKVHVSLKVDPKTGGHDHGDSTRPRGGIAEVENCATDSECWPGPQPTDGNGQVVFNFNAPEASGTHTISATCDGCTNTATKPVDVKVDGLKPIPPSGLYALYETDGSVIGAVKSRHESNHYLTPTAANKLLVIAINYHHLYPKDPVLHINDASLMWGGKFDIYGTWKGKHAEHQRGTVVDIRANTRTGAIPSTNFVNFEKFARFAGADPYLENQGTDLQHYHLRLLNRRE